MHQKQCTTHRFMGLALAMLMAVAASAYSVSATAAKPAWAGNNSEERGQSHNKQGKKKAHEKAKQKSEKSANGKHFNAKDESVVRHYYQQQSRNGKGCPPGLAKKNNGCLPPGQAKKQWAAGKPLSHHVEHHELPRDLLSRLPIPPKGKRYVRILSDVLLIDNSSDVVIDALVDVLIP